MGTPGTDFVEELGRRGHLPQLEQIDGTLRLDLIDGTEIDSWTVVVAHGDVRVSRGRQDADCAIYTERTVFDRIATGEVNALAALLRGWIQIEGDLRLALWVGRALPGPPHSRWRGQQRPQRVGRRRP
jgi:hypothetical protein